MKKKFEYWLILQVQQKLAVLNNDLTKSGNILRRAVVRIKTKEKFDRKMNNYDFDIWHENF